MTTLDPLLITLQTKLMTTGMDAMDVIVDIIQDKKESGPIKDFLHHIAFDDSCRVEFPMNIRVPLMSVVNTNGLLDGMIRHYKRTRD